MAIVESYYKLVIQCNGPTHIFPTLGTFYGDNLGRTKKRARNQGWKFRPENITICPSCAVDEAQKRKKGRKKKNGNNKKNN